MPPKLPKPPKGSKRLKPGAPVHVKGTRVEAHRHADGTQRFSRLNDEGTVSEWRVAVAGETT